MIGGFYVQILSCKSVLVMDLSGRHLKPLELALASTQRYSRHSRALPDLALVLVLSWGEVWCTTASLSSLHHIYPMGKAGLWAENQWWGHQMVLQKRHRSSLG